MILNRYSKFLKQYMVLLLAFVLLLPLAGRAQSQKVVLTARAPKVVGVGERFHIIFEVNRASISSRDFEAPEDMASSFSFLVGPQVSLFSDYQNINGKVTEVSTTQLIYAASADKEGKITLGKAELTVDGKTYQSNKLTIDVVKAQAPRTPSPDGTVTSEDVFMRVSISKSNLYKGDHLIATVRLYLSQGIENIHGFDDLKMPSFDGFYSQVLEEPQHLNFQRENVGGVIYNSALMKSFVLYPQRTGSINIEPLQATIRVIPLREQRRNQWGQIYVSQPQVVRKQLRSAPVTVNVKDLPAGAPASFTGAVGSFKLESSLSKSNVMANNAVTHIVKISGSGNFKLFDSPKFVYPADFEAFEPKVSDNIRSSSEGLSGTRQVEVTLIPRSAGTFTIPQAEFSYFNPTTGSYVTLTSKALELTVEKDTAAVQATVIQTGNQQDVKYLGQDIRACKQHKPAWRAVGSYFYGSMTFYMVLILALLLFIIAIFLLKDRAKKRRDTVHMRTRKANAAAKKRLSLAGKYLKTGNVSQFYEEMLKAYWGYLSDKLNIPLADLSRDTIREVLEKKNVSADVIAAFIGVVDLCEFARYAPEAGQIQMESEYENAIGIISKLEQQIR